jgi:hypothetical protein
MEKVRLPAPDPVPCRLNGCPGPEDITINPVTDGMLGRLDRLGPDPDGVIRTICR